MTITERLVDASIRASMLLERVRSPTGYTATLKALGSCRPRELKDIGLIRDDFAVPRSEAREETIETLSRNASQRAGNW